MIIGTVTKEFVIFQKGCKEISSFTDKDEEPPAEIVSKFVNENQELLQLLRHMITSYNKEEEALSLAASAYYLGEFFFKFNEEETK